MIKKIKVFIEKSDRKLLLIVFVFIVLIMTPIIFQGIMCNDGLSLLFLRKVGLREFFADAINQSAAKGRPLGGIVSIRLLDFVSDNMYVNRLANVILILLVTGLFMYFVYNMNGNKYLSFFCGLVILSCMPITFEIGAPNAFVAVILFPFMLLICSLLLFWRYLNFSKIRYLFYSMMLFLIGMMQYEFIVTYVLMFYVLSLKYYSNIDRLNWKIVLKKIVVPTFIALFYIISYFGIQLRYPSNYSGNTVGLSFRGLLNVLYVLAKSSLPGYFLFNEKHKYLREIYSKQFEYDIFLKIIVYVIVLIFISIALVLFKSGRNKVRKWNWIEMLVAVVFMVVPTIPNSISSMYQELVSESLFTWCPVSICLYFAACFFVSSIIWNCCSYINRYFLWIGVVCMACYVGQIQYMNYIFANQQHIDFTRLEKIENMFDLQLWTCFDEQEIYSKDIYETRNTIAVHDGYWSSYLNKNGLNVSVVNDNVSGKINLFFPNDRYFVLSNQNIAIICSPESLENEWGIVEISPDQCICIKFCGEVYDSGYYFYCFKLNDLYASEISFDSAVNEMLIGD